MSIHWRWIYQNSPSSESDQSSPYAYPIRRSKSRCMRAWLRNLKSSCSRHFFWQAAQLMGESEKTRLGLYVGFCVSAVFVETVSIAGKLGLGDISTAPLRSCNVSRGDGREWGMSSKWTNGNSSAIRCPCVYCFEREKCLIQCKQFTLS